MPFVEGIHQYQSGTASNTQSLNAVKDTIRPLSSYVQELVPGKVFEGTITEIKNGQVTIGLSDGQTITAKMESQVNLEKGQPMLFEVRSNNGEQIAIHPVTLESAQNPTLLKALEAAGLKINEQNLSMVNAMMKEQLPIDRNSLVHMSRLLSNFPKVSLETLVQMQKAGLEINPSSIGQFESYKANQQSFLPQIQNLMKEIPNLSQSMYENSSVTANQFFTTGQIPQEQGMLGFQQQIVEILMGTQGGVTGNPQLGASQSEALLGQVQQNQMIQNLTVEKPEESKGVNVHQDGANTQGGIGEHHTDQHTVPLPQPQMAGTEESGISNLEQTPPVNPSKQVLTLVQQQNLTGLLMEFQGAVSNEQLLPGGILNQNLSAGELLQQILQAVENSSNYSAAFVQRLFQSDEYKNLLKQAMEEQWLLSPEKLKEEGAVKELYQRLGKQMEELQQVLTQAGKAGETLSQTAHTVQSNLEFMNQLSQIYTYVQLPLKLQNQNAHSDLYVYTNKKNLQDKEGELTALLHLDMKQLGATDIYIKLTGMELETNFYMENQVSYELIEKNAGILQKKLEKKGYHCHVQVENRRKQQDFVQEFLEQEKPTGKLQRYSFDVKA
ncbi:MAG: flagellar hook-length control protein FliK [Lachnospiraceae bacterium]